MTTAADNNGAHRFQEVLYVRNPEVLERRIDDTVFLVHQEDDTIFYLNPLSAGLWHLLARPASSAQAVGVVRQAFPDIPAELIIADVDALIADLEKHRLVLRSD